MKLLSYICSANKSNSGVSTYKNIPTIGVSSESRIAPLYGLFAAISEGALSFCTYIFNH